MASGTDFTVENPQAGLNTDIILRRGDESIFIDVKMLRLPPIQKVNSSKLEFYKFENLSDMLDFTRVENIVNSAISSGIKSTRPVVILAIDVYPMPELLNKVSIAQSEINNVILPLIFDKLKVPFKVYFYFVGPYNSESSVPILDVLSFNMLLLNEFNGINHLYTKDLSNSHF